MKNRFMIISMVVMLMLGLTVSISAQEDETVNLCFNLSEADCAIINTAGANNANITSFNHNFSLGFTASGLEILELLGQELPQSFAFITQGEGAFTITPNSEAGLQIDAITTSYQGVILDGAMGTILDELSLLGEDAGYTETLSLTLLDDVIYTPLNGENVSLPLGAIVGIELPFNLQELLPITPELLVTIEPQNWGDVVGLIDLESVLAPDGMDFSDNINFQRLDDVEGMGQALYPFEFTLDVSQLVNRPEVVSAMTTQLTELVSGSDDPMMTIAVQFLPLLLPGVESNLVITEYIGADDNFVHRVTVDFGFLVDLGMLTRPSGSSGESSSIDPLDINLQFDFNLTSINESVEIDLPDDVRPLSQAEIDQFMNSLFSLFGA